MTDGLEKAIELEKAIRKDLSLQEYIYLNGLMFNYLNEKFGFKQVDKWLKNAN